MSIEIESDNRRLKIELASLYAALAEKEKDRDEWKETAEKGIAAYITLETRIKELVKRAALAEKEKELKLLKSDWEIASRVADNYKKQMENAVRIGCENITMRESAESREKSLRAELEAVKKELKNEKESSFGMSVSGKQLQKKLNHTESELSFEKNRAEKAEAEYQRLAGEVKGLREELALIKDSSTAERIDYEKRQYPTRQDMRVQIAAQAQEIKELTEERDVMKAHWDDHQAAINDAIKLSGEWTDRATKAEIELAAKDRLLAEQAAVIERAREVTGDVCGLFYADASCPECVTMSGHEENCELGNVHSKCLAFYNSTRPIPAPRPAQEKP